MDSGALPAHRTAIKTIGHPERPAQCSGNLNQLLSDLPHSIQTLHQLSGSNPILQPSRFPERNRNRCPQAASDAPESVQRKALFFLTQAQRSIRCRIYWVPCSLASHWRRAALPQAAPEAGVPLMPSVFFPVTRQSRIGPSNEPSQARTAKRKSRRKRPS